VADDAEIEEILANLDQFDHGGTYEEIEAEETSQEKEEIPEKEETVVFTTARPTSSRRPVLLQRASDSARNAFVLPSGTDITVPGNSPISPRNVPTSPQPEKPSPSTPPQSPSSSFDRWTVHRSWSSQNAAPTRCLARFGSLGAENWCSEWSLRRRVRADTRCWHFVLADPADGRGRARDYSDPGVVCA